MSALTEQKELMQLINLIYDDNEKTSALFDLTEHPEYADDLVVANTLLDTNKSKVKKLDKDKRKSPIFGKMARYVDLFEMNGFNLDQVTKVLTSLCNYCLLQKITGFTTLPDKFLCKRTLLAREAVEFILDVLEIAGLVNQRKTKYETIIKVNSIVYEDAYIKKKLKSFTESDIKTFNSCIDEGSLMYDNYTEDTINRHNRENILGLSFAFTELAKEKIDKELRTKHIEQFGERGDITYLYVPLPLIAQILHIPFSRITNYFRNCVRSANYLAPHDKVYYKAINGSNYYNENYKQTTLLNIEDAPIVSTHPIVDKYCYIIFNDTFMKTHTYKNIMKKKDIYMRILKNYLINHSWDVVNKITDINDPIKMEQLFENSDIYNNDEENTKIIDIQNSTETKFGYVEELKLILDGNLNVRNIKVDHFNRNHLHFKKPIIYSLRNMNINKALNIIHLTMKRITDVTIEMCDREYFRYTRIVSKLVKWIQSKLDELRNTNLEKFNSTINLLSKMNIMYCFKTC